MRYTIANSVSPTARPRRPPPPNPRRDSRATGPTRPSHYTSRETMPKLTKSGPDQPPLFAEDASLVRIRAERNE